MPSTDVASSSRPMELHPFYYHDHFLEMIGFVTDVYPHCLGPDERRFVEIFHGLPVPAQCLFIRMVNRKTEVFSKGNLDYEEIEGLLDVLDHLREAGFARDATADDYILCLQSYSRLDLFCLAQDHRVPKVRETWGKAKLIDAIVHAVPFDDVFGDGSRFVRANYLEIVRYLLYLFFGKTRTTLLSFTLRDLKLVRIREGSGFAARFASEDEARHSYFYLNLLGALRSPSADLLGRLALEAPHWPSSSSPFVQEKRDEALFLLARGLEKSGNKLGAIALLRLGQSGACRERLVRLLHASGEIAAAAELLEAMIADPQSDDEFHFANDFYARKYQRVRLSPHTAYLREACEIHVDDSYRGAPELAVMDHFTAAGWTGFHSENGLWVSLFALFFWTQLFETEANQTGHFDLYPTVLRLNSFPRLFAADIHTLLEKIAAGEAVSLLTASIQRHFGSPNVFLAWDRGFTDFLAQTVRRMPAGGLAAILEKMAMNFGAMSDGFPDLILLRGDAIKFIEVKGDGDQIQHHQLTRIRQLKDAGFDVDIVRVAYDVDPGQSFVVVDVETTGGRAAFDRVTEIGAVKIQNGLIVDRWQSLINPGRRIPRAITAITGITNEMVADAPRFSEVASQFQAFMQGSIFAAHNVNFDYGFISAEFRRLDRKFRFPKICTVALMRRYFPGHGSYSLASMTREYGIALRSHHRALCDAEAAAHLLMMINERRLDLTKAA